MTETTLTGVLLDERVELTLTEVSEACATSTEWVVELVHEGVLEPLNDDRHAWRFSGYGLSRALAASRLRRDLGLNTAGVALALQMMAEIETLRAKLRHLQGGTDDGAL